MADSKSEQVLKALFTALGAALPASVKCVRNEAIPTKIPAGGYVCLRDGELGAPEALMSPPTYIYEHVAEIDVVVELSTAAARDALFDSLKKAVGVVVAADRTLGGLCDYVLGDAPAPLELPLEGAASLKAATIGVILTYETSDPLA